VSIELSTKLPPGIEHASEIALFVERHPLYTSGKHKTPEGLRRIKRGLIKTKALLSENRGGYPDRFSPIREKHLLEQRNALGDMLIYGELLS
jgi:uncharacterized protein (UPF0210 family)